MASTAVLARVRDFLLPTGCVVCRDWIPALEGSMRPPGLICSRCASRLRVPSWPRCPRCHRPSGTGRRSGRDCLDCRAWPGELAAARSAHVLEGPATALVHALKYGGWHELAGPMGRAMLGALPASDRFDAVVPVPTTLRRERGRGYNQAALLADVVAAGLVLPRIDALRRERGTASQTDLRPEERRENVRGVFGPGPGAALLSGARVLLVDDVLTTGATAGEAAMEATRAGARSITLLTFGRALPGLAGPEAG